MTKESKYYMYHGWDGITNTVPITGESKEEMIRNTEDTYIGIWNSQYNLESEEDEILAECKYIINLPGQTIVDTVTIPGNMYFYCRDCNIYFPHLPVHYWDMECPICRNVLANPSYRWEPAKETDLIFYALHDGVRYDRLIDNRSVGYAEKEASQLLTKRCRHWKGFPLRVAGILLEGVESYSENIRYRMLKMVFSNGGGYMCIHCGMQIPLTWYISECPWCKGKIPESRNILREILGDPIAYPIDLTQAHITE